MCVHGIGNSRRVPLKNSIRDGVTLDLPERWSAQPERQEAVVPGHGSSRCLFAVTVPADQKQGVSPIRIRNGSATLSAEPSLVRVLITQRRELLNLEVSTEMAEARDLKVLVTVRKRIE